MADGNRFLGNPVDLILAPRTARWPLWAMMALGVWVATAPFSYGWRGEAESVLFLFLGLGIFGLALFCRLHTPLIHLAHLNSYAGVGLLASQLLLDAPGPLWAGPLLLGLSLAIPATTTQPYADAPPGWFYNPSAWVQRLPMITFMTLGALVSHSSRPVTFLFLAALTIALTGDRRRWRTAPWAVCASVGALWTAAFAAAAWLAVDPSAQGAGAFVAAALAAILSIDEFMAMRLLLRHAPQLGQLRTDAFWNGGLLPRDEFAPRPNRRPSWAPPQALRRRHSRRRRGLSRSPQQ